MNILIIFFSEKDEKSTQTKTVSTLFIFFDPSNIFKWLSVIFFSRSEYLMKAPFLISYLFLLEQEKRFIEFHTGITLIDFLSKVSNQFDWLRNSANLLMPSYAK